MAEITHLEQIKEIPDELFTAAFVKSLNYIFKWAHDNITDTLNLREIEQLTALRNKLCELAKETFQSVNDKVPVNRRAKHLVVKDIIILGDSLAKNVTSAEVEKVVFGVSPPSADTDAESSNAPRDRILSLILGLQSSVDSLVAENVLLHEKIDILVRNKCSYQWQCNTDKDPEATNSTGTTPPGDISVQSPAPVDEVPLSSPSVSSDPAVSKPLASAANRNPTSSTKSQKAPPKGPSNKNKKEVYVGNVDNNNSCADIASHLNSKSIDIPTSDVRLLKQWHDASSFCIKVQEKDFHKATDSTQPIWPAGIKVRPFLEQAPKGLQSSNAKKNVHHSGRSSGKFRQSSAQPFRQARRSPNVASYDFSLPRRTSQWQFMDYEPEHGYVSRNRFSPLLYDDYESEYDDSWPALGHPLQSQHFRHY